jgi:hypothetical protein
MTSLTPPRTHPPTLYLTQTQTLPAIRNILFGIGNGSRAFFDKETF